MHGVRIVGHVEVDAKGADHRPLLVADENGRGLQHPAVPRVGLVVVAVADAPALLVQRLDHQVGDRTAHLAVRHVAGDVPDGFTGLGEVVDHHFEVPRKAADDRIGDLGQRFEKPFMIAHELCPLTWLPARHGGRPLHTGRFDRCQQNIL